MDFKNLNHYLTGVAVPVSSLKSAQSLGIGEFADLLPLAKWCLQCGLDLIQILPINDTGFETSPYSALSAFALHPIYLRLQSIPGSDPWKQEIEGAQKTYSQTTSVHFADVLKAKLQILHKIFDAQFETISGSKELGVWIQESPWIKEYSVFCTLKHRHHLAGWQSWPDWRTPKAKEIEAFWLKKENKRETLFFCWLQFLADNQLQEVSRQLTEMGVALKGDLPILLNEDSADVWAHPNLFDLSLRAGAPPDATNSDGQNWGFPIYRWDNLAEDDFQWWKDRLKKADLYYHAYRIDHVLGFFRIWGTPQVNYSSNLGFYTPSQTISRQDLYSLGFDDGRILWLADPHIFGPELREKLGGEAARVIEMALEQVGYEDLYKFKYPIRGEKHISELPLTDHAKWNLYQWFRNRTLIRLDADTFLPVHTYYSSRAYDTLSDEEKGKFDTMVKEAYDSSEEIWEEQGAELMKFMKETTNMLVCAEDLGTIPDCVPKVLAEQKILGLKIPRWARVWDEPDQPYIPISEYPFLSVCAPSVHDTSTLRQWWSEEKNREGFFKSLALEPVYTQEYTPEVARRILESFMKVGSQLIILPIQDFFAMEEELRTQDPGDERINLPGTMSDQNWSYRIKPSLEDLLKHRGFSQKIKNLSEIRTQRKTKA